MTSSDATLRDEPTRGLALGRRSFLSASQLAIFEQRPVASALTLNMIEYERTYLVRTLPEGLADCDSKEVLDIYLPTTGEHLTLRIRKHGDKHEMTKKKPAAGADSSEQLEQTIHLEPEEWQELASLPGRRLRKIRYYYPWNGHTAEIDVFQDDLLGLVLADFEFSGPDAKDDFETPEFCLADVTQEKFIAGGMLCGRDYSEIQAELARFGYLPLSL